MPWDHRISLLLCSTTLFVGTCALSSTARATPGTAEHRTFQDEEEPRPALLLGGRMECAISLAQVERESVDVLVGPRVTFDLGLPTASGKSVQPYGTFGATVGFASRAASGKPRFVLMVEPGIMVTRDVTYHLVLASETTFGLFSLAITAGVLL